MEVPAGGQQVFEAQALRHPCAYMSRATSCFVPNDVRMGGGEPPFILLTGLPPCCETPACRSFGGACEPDMVQPMGLPCTRHVPRHSRRMSVEQDRESWLMIGLGVQVPTWAAKAHCCGRRALLRCWLRCDDQTASCPG